MGTTSQKLEYLGVTKSKIKDSINLTGANLTTEPFRQYATVLKDKLAEMLVDPTPIWNNFPKTTGTGSTIAVNTYASWFDYSLEGNTTQEGTPTPSSPQQINNVTGLQEVDVKGLNLYNPINLDFVVTSSRYSKSGNGVISTTPSAIDWASATPHMTTTPTDTQISQIQTYGIPVEPSTKYTLVFDNPNGCMNEALIFQYDKDYKYIRNNSIGSKTDLKRIYSITLQSNCEYVMFRFDNEDYDYGAKQFSVQNIMWLKGEYTSSNVPSYEEYKGKSYEINLGYNYLPITLVPKSILNGMTIDYDSSTGYITINGTATDTTNFVWDFDDVLLPSTTYVQYENDFSTGNAQILYFNGSTQIGGLTFNGLNRIYNLSASIGGKILNRCSLYIANGTTITNGKIRPMIHQQSTIQHFSPYFTPIELNKINTYKDLIFKGKGINLFSSEMEIGGIDNDTGQNAANTNCIRSIDYIEVEPNTTYTLINTMSYNALVHEYRQDKSYIQYDGNYNVPRTFTTTANTHYIKVRSAAGNVQNNLNAKYMLYKGSYDSSILYEPYNAKDKWYLHKETGKVVLNGSENWSANNVQGGSATYMQYFISYNLGKTGQGYSNHFTYNSGDTGVGNHFYINSSGTLMVFPHPSYNGSDIANTTEWKSWLASNNTIVYYVLANPTTTEITNSELLEDLDSIELLNGLNNITINGDLSAIMDLIALEKE